MALRPRLEDEDGSGLVGGGGCHESGERGKNSKIESRRRLDRTRRGRGPSRKQTLSPGEVGGQGSPQAHGRDLAQAPPGSWSLGRGPLTAVSPAFRMEFRATSQRPRRPRTLVLRQAPR